VPDILQGYVQMNPARKAGHARDAEFLPGQDERAFFDMDLRHMPVPRDIPLIAPGMRNPHIIPVTLSGKAHLFDHATLRRQNHHRVALVIDRPEIDPFVQLQALRRESVIARHVEPVDDHKTACHRVRQKKSR
jgi:hypothetical protein